MQKTPFNFCLSSNHIIHCKASSRMVWLELTWHSSTPLYAEYPLFHYMECHFYSCWSQSWCDRETLAFRKWEVTSQHDCLLQVLASWRQEVNQGCCQRNRCPLLLLSQCWSKVGRRRWRLDHNGQPFFILSPVAFGLGKEQRQVLLSITGNAMARFNF